ncbi:glutamate-5-semialdehyde dehydrogenase [uncultured Castellaniella sp.]|uniref:glutamate-5-semialdehyde dehydrogenase n=1 Tax=uncultured Castellaniella sp. TaxID=647907 RepID=UPI002604B7C9|nr:glutamate-5-semialdehyde dehydrogenase [uncultured Castellaniella sp.]
MNAPESVLSPLEILGRQARQAARRMRTASSAAKSAALLAMAEQLQSRRAWLQAENERDLRAAAKRGLEAPLMDRLRLSDKALDTMAAGLAQIAAMPDPIGGLSETTLRPNGMRVARMRVPLGVIGIIYESRPNVTIDAAALCLKSGNATILRGGSEAFHSNQALGGIIQAGLQAAGLPPQAVQVVDTTDRAAVGEMVTLTDYIDVIIPRGGKSLIARLSAESRVPLIKHLEGNCHLYVDRAADPDRALDIAINAKTYRTGICGAMETLLVHADIAASWLPRAAARFTELGVELRACPRAAALMPGSVPATDEDWATEFLAPILAVRVVDSLDDAMDHIARYSSEHTESIVTEDLAAAQRFQREVDSSSVYVNLPTCFADGFEYGLGAEIGISTNRLHARGPVGLEGLTIQKWVLTGEGQLRG